MGVIVLGVVVVTLVKMQCYDGKEILIIVALCQMIKINLQILFSGDLKMGKCKIVQNSASGEACEFSIEV